MITPMANNLRQVPALCRLKEFPAWVERWCSAMTFKNHFGG